MAICSYLWCRNLLSLETNNTAFLIWKSFPACCIVFISSQCILFIYFSGSFMLETFLKCVVNFGHIFTFQVRRPCRLVASKSHYIKLFWGESFLWGSPQFLAWMLEVSWLNIYCLLGSSTPFSVWYPMFIFSYAWRLKIWILADVFSPGT